MKTRFTVLIVILIAAASFLAGAWVTFQGGRGKATAERTILHYVDPMNPAFKSDKPGIAPCGMPLEPVYADQGPAAAVIGELRASLPPGTIRIAPEKQQVIGVKTTTVEKVPWSHTLRVLGRVAPDETLVYRINAATDCWVEKALPVTTGSLVKENELLATLSFFSLEYRTLVQNYFNLITLGQAASSPGEPNQPVYEQPKRAPEQKTPYSAQQLRQMRKAARGTGDVTGDSQIDYYRKYLYNYGISPYQLDEMERTRTFPEVVEVRAPAAGFILFRNVSPGYRHDKGAELFRIADLSRVWILADIFENEAAFFKPGMRVRMELPYQRRTLYAEVSPVLPQFDPATRTLKVRLVADNPGYLMRPDMFVNVELPASGPPAMIVPVDAVLDSGLNKTVFVDRGNGFFEPRQVETGRMLGERVEISRGLMPGEKIVVSGNFLIDSEARMQQAAAGIAGKIGRDPVCRMNIDEDRAKADGNLREYKGKSYFFCSPECRDEFAKDPDRYLKSSPAQGALPAAGSHTADAKHPAPAAAPRGRGAKASPDAHGGMTMPAGKTPAAMPGMPAVLPDRESEKGRMVMPPAAVPGMVPQAQVRPGEGGMSSMPQGTAAPMPQPGPAMPGSKPGEGFPPAMGVSGMNQPPQPSSGPDSGSMPLPGPGDAPMPGAQQADPLFPAPAPGTKPGEVSPPGPGRPEVKR
ncbi:MAG: efflux RND transporter periplasmic adaptor subunit [Syntrophales bacterium]